MARFNITYEVTRIETATYEASDEDAAMDMLDDDMGDCDEGYEIIAVVETGGSWPHPPENHAYNPLHRVEAPSWPHPPENAGYRPLHSVPAVTGWPHPPENHQYRPLHVI